MRLEPALLVSSHLFIRKLQERVLENVKFLTITNLPTEKVAVRLRVSLQVTDSKRFIAHGWPDTSMPADTFDVDSKSESDVIAGMFMSIFEGKLGDP